MAILSDLPHDVLVVISKRLKKLEDFVSLRCVSKSLHAAAKDEYFEGLRCRQRIPYLLLPVRDDDNDDVRELYSLVEGESIVASVKAPNLKNKKCFESLGWLLAVGDDGSMSLLDPISGSEILLPHQHNIPEYELFWMDEQVFIQKMVLSSRPRATLDFVVMVILGQDGHSAFWRFGDKTWNIIKERIGRYVDVIHNGGEQFYAIGYPGVVWAFNLAGKNNHAEAHLILHCKPIVPRFLGPDYPDHPSRNLYLLKTVDDILLIITRISPILSEDGSSYITTKFQVYEVERETSTWKEIYSLGSMAVFVGHNSTIALDASELPGGVIKANHIYFTDDDWGFYFFNRQKAVARTWVYIIWKRDPLSHFIPGSRCAVKFPPPYGLPLYLKNSIAKMDCTYLLIIFFEGS